MSRLNESGSVSSDIDLIVHSKDGRQWRPEELEALMLVLREAFCRHRICTQEGIQLLNGATVPIIKLTDRRTDVKVDMSFNMNNGLRSAQLILVRTPLERMPTGVESV
jgi:non-canonical poly(A) RNA polymerase PAPD5/7